MIGNARAISERQNETSRASERAILAPLYLMVAIGAQCRGLKVAASYFSHARKMAFEDSLENPSVDCVRIFLLMAYYMLGASRRNSACMYIGVASRSADILALHVPAYHQHATKDERDTRHVKPSTVMYSRKLI